MGTWLEKYLTEEALKDRVGVPHPCIAESEPLPAEPRRPNSASCQAPTGRFSMPMARDAQAEFAELDAG